MTKKPKIIVIIAAYNGRQYWPDLLPLLVNERYVDFIVEIVVVDNNSSDDSAGYIRSRWPSVTVICNQANLGFVGANNIGYRYAQKQGADYIYLLNQDTIISPGWLQPLYDFAANNKFGSLQSKLLLWPDKNFINTAGNAIHYLGFGYGLLSGQPDRALDVREINYASGAGVFLSLKTLAEILEPNQPLFDEAMFMYLEDLDLGWALSLGAYNNYLIPQSVIYHKYHFDRSMKHYYWFERNRLWVLGKNYKLATLLLLLPAALIMEAGQIFFALRRRHFWQKIRAYGWLISYNNWRVLIFQRRLRQSKRVVSDREILNRFSGFIKFQELSSPLLVIGNVFFYAYRLIIKIFIFW